MESAKSIWMEFESDSMKRALLCEDLRQALRCQAAFKAAMNQSLDLLRQKLGASLCGLWGLDAASGKLSPFWFRGEEDFPLPPSSAQAGTVLAGNGVAPLALFGAEEVQRSFAGCKAQSVISAPVYIQRQRKGVLSVFNHLLPNFTTSDDTKVIQGSALSIDPNTIPRQYRADAENLVAEVANVFGQEMAHGLAPVVGRQRLESGDYELAWVLARKVKWCVFGFADLRGFTPLADLLAKHPVKVHDEIGKTVEVAVVVNQYLSAIADIVWRRGRIDKFMGDGVMMVFGDLHQEQGGEVIALLKALCAARQMQEAFENIRQRWENGWIAAFKREFNEDVDLRLGIGFSCGPATFDFYGSAEHQEYSAIGDTVNVAKRLESQSRHLDSNGMPCEPILISQTMFSRLSSFFNPKFDPKPHLIVLKGKGHPVRAYGVTGFDEAQCATAGARCPDCPHLERV